MNMINDVVSFIFPNRGGLNLDKAIQNINEVYSDMNKEIIVVEQADDKPFLRGQLFNIGVRYAQGTYIALSDNDMYHLRKVPWIELYESVKKPLIGFKYISQIRFENGKPVITSTTDCPTGFGGFNFMRRTDFIGFNGFSNLFVGWGFEDNAYSTRFEYARVRQDLGHITHPIRNYQYPKNRAYNMELWHSETTRDKMLDGFKQTTYTEVSQEQNDNVLTVKVNNISVCDDFAYKDLLEKHYSIMQ